MGFEIVKECGSARVGKLKTAHGVYETPIFMPVGTNANVKLMRSEDLKEIGVGILLGNSYHLAVRPGLEVIELHGGLHQFMNWDGAILTDSGGFQVFSLKKLIKISDEGVLITSPVDGSKIFLTPELSMKIQRTLNSDIVMVLDHCPSPADGYKEVLEATKRTYRWALKCLKEGVQKHQLLFAIAQGGTYEDLRIESAKSLSELPFDGFAIGGLSLGEEYEKTLYMSEVSVSCLPKHKPRYFMGGGSPALIVRLVEIGVDMFDSVFPTRLARHGTALTWEGRLNVKASRYKMDKRPIDEKCSCKVCRNYTRSYIHHLIDREETLGGILLTYHNLYFMMDFMKRLRESILQGTFGSFKEEVLKAYEKDNVVCSDFADNVVDFGKS
nr:tRNA guanosine(34) transglycosylase Tgt [Pseudothermotoga thermarum]